MITLDGTLDAVLSTALDAAIAMREDGSIAAWNSVAESTFGWSFAEVEGRQLSHVIIPPDFRRRHEEGLIRYLATGVPSALGKRIEVSAIDRGGRRFPAELSTTELAADGERIFIGFIRDISARRQAENNIREVTERLELAVGAHSIGVFDTNVETGHVHWSTELERIYGYGPGEFDCTLDGWRGHLASHELARLNSEFKNAIAAQASDLAYSYRITRRDGQVREIEASVRFFYDHAGENIRHVGVNIDVTDRKAAERRLSETQAELLHVSRLNSLGAMASSLSHELNQPLTAVTSYISGAKNLLERGRPGAARLALEALSLASASTARVGELIKRLRGMAGKGVVEREPVDIAPLIKEVWLLAKPGHDKRQIVFDCAIDDGAEIACADPILLQQVLFNLLRNATEALAATGGRVTVRSLPTSEDCITIQVEDDGPGLDPDVEANLFTAFVSSKSDGMGVGLSICRTIIENNGGKIWATSTPQGTSFFFTLPRAAVDGD